MAALTRLLASGQASAAPAPAGPMTRARAAAAAVAADQAIQIRPDFAHFGFDVRGLSESGAALATDPRVRAVLLPMAPDVRPLIELEMARARLEVLS